MMIREREGEGGAGPKLQEHSAFLSETEHWQGGRGGGWDKHDERLQVTYNLIRLWQHWVTFSVLWSRSMVVGQK